MPERPYKDEPPPPLKPRTLADLDKVSGSFWILCRRCGRTRRLFPEKLPPAVLNCTLREFSLKLRCTRCGERGWRRQAIVLHDRNNGGRELHWRPFQPKRSLDYTIMMAASYWSDEQHVAATVGDRELAMQIFEFLKVRHSDKMLHLYEEQRFLETYNGLPPPTDQRMQQRKRR